MHDMLDHEQRGRPVFELLAAVAADVAALVAATRAQPLGQGQFVMPGFAEEIRGQPPPAVRPGPPLRRLGFRRFRRRLRDGVFGRDVEEQRLAGVETLASRPVQPSQQEIKPMP